VRFICVCAVALLSGPGCSGRSHDGGPTTAPEPGTAPAGSAAATPARPGRPLDAAAIDALAAVTVTGHDIALARRGARDLATLVTAPGGTRVTVTASVCLGCAPMALAAWEARRAELAALWAPSEAGGDALVLAAPSVAGHTVIAVDALRTLDGERRHTYQLHWNDGVSQLAAVCEASAPATDAGIPAPDDCAAATATVLGAYLPAMLAATVTD
jgi:hypothetical protein